MPRSPRKPKPSDPPPKGLNWYERRLWEIRRLGYQKANGRYLLPKEQRDAWGKLEHGLFGGLVEEARTALTEDENDPYRLVEDSVSKVVKKLGRGNERLKAILDPRALAAYIQTTVRHDIAEEVKKRNERQVTARQVFIGDVIVPLDDPGDTSATDEEKQLRLPESRRLTPEEKRWLKETATGHCAICDNPLYQKFDPENRKHYKEPGWRISERWHGKPLDCRARRHTLSDEFDESDEFEEDERPVQSSVIEIVLTGEIADQFRELQDELRQVRQQARAFVEERAFLPDTPQAAELDPPKYEIKITRSKDGKRIRVERVIQGEYWNGTYRVMIGTGRAICSTCEREIAKTPLAWEAAQKTFQTNDRAPGWYPERVQGIRRKVNRVPRYPEQSEVERLALYERNVPKENNEPLPEPGEAMAEARPFEIAATVPFRALPYMLRSRVLETQRYFPGLSLTLKQLPPEDFVRWLGHDVYGWVNGSKQVVRQDLDIEPYNRHRALRSLRGILEPYPCEYCSGPIYESDGRYRFCSDGCRRASANPCK